MFNLHDFILKGLKKAIGKMADYQVMLNAVGWFEKGVLLEADLAELESLIDAGEDTAKSVSGGEAE